MDSDAFAAPMLNIVDSHDLASIESYDRGSSLLSKNEQELLSIWNASGRSYPKDACLPQLIERQAIATPGAVALVVDNQKISYQELNQRANQLAYTLRKLGVGPNVLVGVYLERSAELVVGMLGILKAGGAYVPLDIHYPQDRLSFMLEDAGISILVTREQIAIDLPIQKIRVLSLDSDAIMRPGAVTTNLPPLATTKDLVYVIYTSGSTGRPKGVQITHDSLLNLIFWHQRAFAVTEADRATQVTSPAFDATGWELWPYLTMGASVYMPDEDIRVDPVLLRDWLLEQGITIAFLPTALAERVIALEWPASTALRFLLTGADVLHQYPSPDLPFALINNYGPTEATVVATSGRVSACLPEERPTVAPSIGKPIDNTQIYILDEHLQQVRIGEIGELYIGGAGLAAGYLNQPTLTAERFIRNPFSSDGVARLYKTGDQARYLTDGQIAFMGRNDYQIKIRGYRIEPGEVVAAINRHLAVETSYVMAREDIAEEKRLVAYVVLIPGIPISLSSLQETVRMQLPDYMIPTSFVLLDELPLTANGKVDRAALPVPDATNTLRDEEVVEPSTPTEKKVAEIVTTLLERDEIGIDDNFFMLGGHSLLGTQMIARIAETFSVELSLRSLFDIPTVRLLAEEIERIILINVELMSDEEVHYLLERESR